jgi:hypothetical protein
MIRETRDPAVINHFAAHPDIAHHIGGPLDFTDAIRETAVFLFGVHGGLIYEWRGPATWEAHVMITEAGRGWWGFEAVKRSIEIMAEKGADRLWARVKPEDRHIAMLALKTGFRDAGTMTLSDPEPTLYRIFEWRK